MKSKTLSEELAEKYCLPCGVDTAFGRMSFHSLATCSTPLPDKKEREKMRHLYEITSGGLFGADAWRSTDGSVSIAKVCPQIGGVGWARYPGADHWQATDASGRVIMRTQNYGALLRWFFLKLRKAGNN